jgi:hypothetical protein
VATLLRNQALLEYNQAIAKIPKAITDAADSFVTLATGQLRPLVARRQASKASTASFLL